MSEEEIKKLQEENEKLKQENQNFKTNIETLTTEKNDINNKYTKLKEEHDTLIKKGKPLPDGKTGDELFAELFK